jgi:hypothetical protein
VLCERRPCGKSIFENKAVTQVHRLDIPRKIGGVLADAHQRLMDEPQRRRFRQPENRRQVVANHPAHSFIPSPRRQKACTLDDKAGGEKGLKLHDLLDDCMVKDA